MLSSKSIILTKCWSVTSFFSQCICCNSLMTINAIPLFIENLYLHILHILCILTWFLHVYFDVIHPQFVVIILVGLFCPHDIIRNSYHMIVCYWPIIGFFFHQNPIPLLFFLYIHQANYGSCLMSALVSYSANSSGFDSFIYFITTQSVDP